MPSAKILVIDDEKSILDLVTAYLRNEGYEYHTAMDGPSGLKAARAFKPDLIVLDIMLPGMDGIELLSRLRRESDVYVCSITSYVYRRSYTFSLQPFLRVRTVTNVIVNTYGTIIHQQQRKPVSLS